jgi:glycerophosphoryl diester phosphodiesterase
LIIGHRGASAVAPENTLAAFARALHDGAHGIEFDVRLAADGVPVIIHDATLRRTGLQSEDVGLITSRELAAVDVGSWFNRAQPALARAEYEQQRIPTLEEVFEFVHDRPGVIYVELKSEDKRAARHLVQSVAGSIAQFGFDERVVVVSFDHEALAETKSLNPKIRTGALFSPRPGRGLNWRAGTILDATRDCGADELLLHRLLARPGLIKKAGEVNLPVVVWTVDDPAWVGRARLLGIKALITNHPAAMLGVT